MVETTQKLVVWKRVDSQGAELEYDPQMNFKIEQAYLKKHPKYGHEDDTENFTIDFSKMTETDHTTVPDKIYKIKRIDLHEGEWWFTHTIFWEMYHSIFCYAAAS